MNKPFIKICGITNIKDAALATSLNVNSLGFNMYEKSARYIPKEKVQEIIGELPENTIPVMVFVDPTFDYVRSCLDISPKIIPQFHGKETQEFCSSFEREYIKAVRVSKKEDLEFGSQNYSNAWMILFDSYINNQFGGTGQVFDWNFFKGQNIDKDYLVAGGLNADNVLKAITSTLCKGIDVSSGVESSPGIKDLEKMEKLIKIINESHG